MTEFVTALNSLTWPGAAGFVAACAVVAYLFYLIFKG